MNTADQVREKLLDLETRLQQAVPNIKTVLKDVHSILKNDPDCVTLLSDEECAILVRGLKKQTATEIATAAASSKPKKSLKSMTTADL